jgi:hypothetical protein
MAPWTAWPCPHRARETPPTDRRPGTYQAVTGREQARRKATSAVTAVALTAGGDHGSTLSSAATPDHRLPRPESRRVDGARSRSGADGVRAGHGLVALTLGCLALGAYIGRDLSGGIGILFFVAGFACIFGLSICLRARTTRPARNHSSLRPRAVAGAGAWSRPGLVREGRSSSALAGRRSHRHVRSHPRYGRLRNSPRPFLVVPRPVLGAAGVARVRDRRDLRLDP